MSKYKYDISGSESDETTFDMDDDTYNIGTHSETFHPDEVTACAILSSIYPNYKFIRSRKPEDHKLCDILVDVGGIYDEVDKFDHHQSTFNEKFDEKSVSIMSSAGLIWKHFGKDYIDQFLQTYEYKSDKQQLIEELHSKFYHHMIHEIDAWDNGVYAGETPNFKTYLSFGKLISNFNDDNVYSVNQNDNFENAVAFARDVIYKYLKNMIRNTDSCLYEYEDIAENLSNRNNKNIAIFDKEYNMENLYKYERLTDDEDVMFIVLPRGNSQYQVYTRRGSTQFKSKYDLIPMEKLPNKYESLVFIHKNLFIAVFNDKEDAIRYAKDCVNEYKLEDYFKKISDDMINTKVENISYCIGFSAVITLFVCMYYSCK